MYVIIVYSFLTNQVDSADSSNLYTHSVAERNAEGETVYQNMMEIEFSNISRKRLRGITKSSSSVIGM